MRLLRNSSRPHYRWTKSRSPTFRLQAAKAVAGVAREPDSRILSSLLRNVQSKSSRGTSVPIPHLPGALAHYSSNRACLIAPHLARRTSFLNALRTYRLCSLTSTSRPPLLLKLEFLLCENSAWRRLSPTPQLRPQLPVRWSRLLRPAPASLELRLQRAPAKPGGPTSTLRACRRRGCSSICASLLGSPRPLPSRPASSGVVRLASL